MKLSDVIPTADIDTILNTLTAIENKLNQIKTDKQSKEQAPKITLTAKQKDKELKVNLSWRFNESIDEETIAALKIFRSTTPMQDWPMHIELKGATFKKPANGWSRTCTDDDTLARKITNSKNVELSPEPPEESSSDDSISDDQKLALGNTYYYQIVAEMEKQGSDENVKTVKYGSNEASVNLTEEGQPKKK